MLLRRKSLRGRVKDKTTNVWFQFSAHTDTYELGNYLSLVFTSSDTWLNSTVVHDGYSESYKMNVRQIILAGVPHEVSEVTINGTSVDFYNDPSLQVRIQMCVCHVLHAYA